MSQSLYGVNLSSYLVLEQFFSQELPCWQQATEDVRKCGEQAMMQWAYDQGQQKYNEVVQQVQQYRQRLITEQDIQLLSQAGIQCIRVPVGFWIKSYNLGSKPDQWQLFAPGSLQCLDNVMQWCDRYGIKVMISLHAHLGSQNGELHSAPHHLGQLDWFDWPNNVEDSVDTAMFVVKRYPSLYAMELCNEPAGPSPKHIEALKNYYQSAYKAVRSVSNCNLVVSFPFPNQCCEPQYHNFLSAQQGYTNVIMAHHFYALEDGMTADAQMKSVQQDAQKINSYQGNPLMVTEFSAAAPYSSTFSKGDNIQQFIGAQYEVFGKTAGTFFWGYKFGCNDDGSNYNGWSWLSMYKHGFLPGGAGGNAGSQAAHQLQSQSAYQQSQPQPQQHGSGKGFMSKIKSAFKTEL